MEQVDVDVAVVGVGAMGSATLWRLGERGVRAVGFEQFQPGHDRGSSHGESRIFRTAYLEGSAYVPLAQRAVQLWHELDGRSDESLVIQNGALTLGARHSPNIEGTLQSIRAHNLQHRLLTVEDVSREYPAHIMDPSEMAIQEGQAGVVRPESAIRTMALTAERLGARILGGTIVTRIEPEGAAVSVHAGNNIYRARHVIVSAGTWIPKLLPQLQLPVRVTRQILSWFPITANAEQFAPHRFPVFLRDINAERLPDGRETTDSSFYGFPTLDGRTVKLSVHREGATADPDNLDRVVRPEDLVMVQGFIRRFLRDVDAEPVRTQVCMYGNTPDHDFLIGPATGLPGITILGGFSGHGFKFAPVIGEIAADFAVDGGTRHPVEFLSPNRFRGP